MHKLIILIEDVTSDRVFDERWPNFLHWAEKMPGLRREVSGRVAHSLFGSHPCRMIHELYFDSEDTLRAALASPEGSRAGQILQRITGGRMSLLVADHLADDLENFSPSTVEPSR